MQTPKRIILMMQPNSYGNGAARGVIAHRAAEQDWEYYLDIGPSSDSLERVRAALATWNPHGMILHYNDEEIGFVSLVEKAGIPIVNISGHWAFNTPPKVHPDDRAVGQLAAEHLLECGLRNFCYIGHAECEYSRQRHAGFSEAIAAKGHSCHIYTMPALSGGRAVNPAGHWQHQRFCVGEVAKSLPKPCGVLCANDVWAREVIWSCKRGGVVVPDEVAVVGVNNDELGCLTCAPPLSSVDVWPQEVGRQAAILLAKMMDGEPAPSAPILIQPKGVVARQSSDMTAVDDQQIANAIQFIRDNAAKPMRVGDVLSNVPVSRRALERGFARLLGRTPADEITRVHVEQAKRLLSETDLAMPGVAARSGFSSQALLSVVFKRQTGMRPTDYRRQFRLTQMTLQPPAAANAQ